MRFHAEISIEIKQFLLYHRDFIELILGILEKNDLKPALFKPVSSSNSLQLILDYNLKEKILASARSRAVTIKNEVRDLLIYYHINIKSIGADAKRGEIRVV
jgi:hypothetical protein